MIGVVLAAGRASRMPNKLLLATKRAHPLVVDALFALDDHEVSDVRMVVGADSAIPDVVRYYMPETKFYVQPEPTGVILAILAAFPDGIPSDPDERIAVLCGDNLYPATEPWPWEAAPVVVVREVAEEERRRALLRYLPAERRLIRGPQQSADPDERAVTTPWILRGQDLEVGRWIANPDRVEDWFRELPITFHGRGGQGWWDLGTPDAYQLYWRGSDA